MDATKPETLVNKSVLPTKNLAQNEEHTAEDVGHQGYKVSDEDLAIPRHHNQT